MTLEEVQSRIDDLTHELKSLESSDPSYKSVWEERTFLIQKRNELKLL